MKTLLAFCLLLLPICLAAPNTLAEEFSAKPNVLLIITDEHNFRTLGCYRELMPREQAEMWGFGAVVETPHLDRLAAEGILCTRAYATSPVCSPCRAAMITGRYPHSAGVPTNNFVLERSVPTLADRLNDAGYRTGFIGKWHLGGDGKPEWAPEIDGGFEFTDYMFNRGHWKKFVLTDTGPAVGAMQNGSPSYAVDDANEETFATDWLTDRTIEYATDADDARPFFAVVSYPDPHGPNTVREPYDTQYDNLPFQPPRTYLAGEKTPGWLGGVKKHPVFRGDDMSRYFGMVKCLDDNIGRLLAALKQSGRLDNTLIVMTSDHGDLCYEHDRQNKGNPYEGSARVPLILRMPGRLPGGRVQRKPVGTVDITPTVCGLLNLPDHPQDEGRNLATTLSQLQPTDGAESKDDGDIIFLRNSGTSAGWVAAVDRRYKLILSVNDSPWLFDAREDPDELKNFYGTPGTESVSRRLAEALREYGRSVKDPYLQHPKIAASVAEVLGEAPPAPEAKKDLSAWTPDWGGSRRWVSPHWWANPLTDWSVRNDSAVATAAANRTLCLLPFEVTEQGDQLTADVTVRLPKPATAGTGKATTIAAGFRFGRRGGIDDYRHALVHCTKFVDAAVRMDGRLILAGRISDTRLPAGGQPTQLQLQIDRRGTSADVNFKATQAGAVVTLNVQLPLDEVVGGLSLLANGPQRAGGTTDGPKVRFSDFSLQGDLARHFEERAFGPILWSQYTRTRNHIRLMAQLAPLGPNRPYEVELYLKEENGETTAWQPAGKSLMDPLSRTVHFDFPAATENRPQPYELRMSWRNQLYRWSGTIRSEPAADAPLSVACFSCDNGYLFPIPPMAAQVERQDPDLLFFAGDQIYESYGGFGVARDADTSTAMLDYLRKYYQFGWTWRELLKDRPSVILPDDHDVFQGNLWGHGGRRLPSIASESTPSGERRRANAKNNWALGGYRMPADWVNAVEKTQVGHLPPSPDQRELPMGIRPWYTSMDYGGVRFAILEDRKFKTGPLSLPESKRKTGDDADLLGAEQEGFLQAWAEDKEDARPMRCVLSQTIFCNAATHTGRELKRSRYDNDSGGWPYSARNRAVRIMGDCGAFAIHGDQHLGILLRHGVSDYDDANYALMVPGTANGFPRAWWPGVDGSDPSAGDDYRGRYRDDAGHPIHVLAVGNPEPGSHRLPKTEAPMEIGYRKGSGYGLVVFRPSAGEIDVNLYRLGDQDEQFSGFPVTIRPHQ